MARARSFASSARANLPRMNYEGFKRLWVWALGESRLAIVGVDPLEETLDLRSTERTCKSFVDATRRQHPEPFHVSAALEFRWDALLADALQ
jgi:hypothetical protein